MIQRKEKKIGGVKCVGRLFENGEGKGGGGDYEGRMPTYANDLTQIEYIYCSYTLCIGLLI